MSKFKREEKDIEEPNGKDAFNVNYYFTKEYKERFDECITGLLETFKSQYKQDKLDETGAG